MKLTCLKWVWVLGLLFTGSIAYGQTSTWNGSSWSNGAPSSSTGSYTFIINGNGCTIASASMSSLTINPGFSCTISGTVNSTTVNIPFDSNMSDQNLVVKGTLNVTNLTIIGWLTGTGTVNLNAGTFSMFDGTNYGYCDVYNFNVLSGSITIPTQVSFQSMAVSQGASVDLNYTGTALYPSINNLTLNGSFINDFYYSLGNRSVTYYYLELNNLTINATGSFNSTNGYSRISQSFKIGGTITYARSANSYSYNFNSPSSTNVLEVFGSANLKYSDLSTSDPSYQYLGTLKVYGGGKFTIDKNLTVNTLTINANGNILTSGTPTLTVNTSIDPIAGRLILQGATLNYAPTSLTLNGTNAALAYLNMSNYSVTTSGTTDTIRNCTFQQLNVNSGAGYISNNVSGYKIQRIVAAAPTTIASLPKTDTIQVSANVLLTGDTRVNRLLDIASGVSVTSNGNLTMRDSSNLYFVTDGQIVGDIKWQRKYGSSGWILMGVPFRHLNRGMVTSTGGIAQQTIHMNKFVESKASPRWVAVASTDTFGVGTGYDLAMTTITNDTLIFTGQPRLQTVTVSGMSYTPSNGQFDYQRGYNLVSNPYTAPISISGFFAANPQLNKIYFYDNIFQNNGLYVIRTSGGVLTPDTTAVTVKNRKKISASYIAPNQGFFIKLDSTNYTTTTSVSFSPSSITRDLNNNFLKSDPVYLRLYGKNSTGTRNDIVFQFNDAATSDINPAFDFSKLLSDSYPLEMYSIKKGGRFSIQTLKLDTGVYVPIGLIVKNSGKHSLWVSNFDALPSGCDIYIYDKVANRTVNLKDSAFTVNLSAGTYDTRFEVVFKDNLSTGINQPIVSTGSVGQNSVIARSNNGFVFVDFLNEEKNVDIQMFDLNGRMVYEEKFPTAQGTVQLDSNFSLSHIYLIKISAEQLSKTSKLLIQ